MLSLLECFEDFHFYIAPIYLNIFSTYPKKYTFSSNLAYILKANPNLQNERFSISSAVSFSLL